MRLWVVSLVLFAVACTAQIADPNDALAAFPADVRAAHRALKTAGDLLKQYFKQLNDQKVLVKQARQHWVKAHLHARNLKAAGEVAQARITKRQTLLKLAQSALETHKRLTLAPAQAKVDADSLVKAAWVKRKQVAQHNLRVHQQLTLKGASAASTPHIRKEIRLVNQWFERHQRHVSELQAAVEQAAVLEAAVKKAEAEFDAVSRLATSHASSYETARRRSAALFQTFKETFQKRKEYALQVIRQVRVVRRRIRAVHASLKRAVVSADLLLKKAKLEVARARAANLKDARDVKEATKDLRDARRDFMEARDLMQDTQRSLKEAKGFFRTSKKVLSAAELKLREQERMVERYRYAVSTFTRRFPTATQASSASIKRARAKLRAARKRIRRSKA